MLSNIELSIHRKGTESFINADPTQITLIPSTESWVGGSKTFGSGTPRAAQSFKVIWSGSQDGIVVNSEGKTRRFDFILVGKYNAVINIGDYWVVNNQHYQVEWIAPSNGYEVKAGGSSHGSKPTG
jgi:hypothetical protein